MKIKYLAALLLMVSLICSCNRNVVFDESVPIDNAKWDSQNWAYFNIDIQDTTAAYDFYLTLRHLENYYYSNLYVFMHTTLPNGVVTNDTIECILAESDGRWLGKGSGTMRNVKVLLNNNLHFPMKGKYQFELEQAMWDSILDGITDVGLRIEKKKQE